MNDIRRTQGTGSIRVTRRNQVTLPISALTSAGIKPGDRLTVEAMATGEIVLRRTGDPLERYYGSMTGLFQPGFLRDIRDEWE